MSSDARAERLLTAALARAHKALRPGIADDWQATLVLAVTDGPDRGLHIQDGRVQVQRDSSFRRTARFEADTATWLELLQGKLPAARAFELGRLRTGEPAVLLRFARAFDWSAAASELHELHGEGPRPSPLPPRLDGQPPVGKRYDGGWHLVRPEDIQAFAAATDDPHPAYEGPGALAPPMFHVRPMRDLLFAVMEDPELDLDMLRLLHGEHDATFHQPLRAGQVLHCRGLLEQLEEKRSGLLVGARFFGLVQGELVIEARSRFFVRSSSGPKASPPAGSARPVRPPRDQPPAPDVLATIQVADDQSLRYAAASGDRNPLHLDPEVARAAGFPDVILHGLCTMSLAAAELVRQLGEGDPRRLRRIGLRWARPVHNGQQLQLRCWRADDHVDFDLLGPDGEPVVVRGHAVLS